MSGVSGEQPAFEAIARLFSEHTGLALPANRREFIVAGIRKAMSKAGVGDATDYHGHLSHAGRSFDDLIGELTVGETYFFRDTPHFDFIRQEVLPERRSRCGADYVLRAWSAGCASGEEAYSLAITFEEEGLAGRSHILATDISRAALTKARDASYGAWSMRNWGEEQVDRYFRRKGQQFVLSGKIRDRVTFAYLNLAFDAYPGPLAGKPAMDLILCRNVLMYLEPERIPQVAERLFNTLAEGGWLITGPSDPPLSSHAPYRVAVTSAGVLYRRPARPSAFFVVAQPVDVLAAPPEPRSAHSHSHDGEPIPELTVPARPSPSELKQAFERGDYTRVVSMTKDWTDDASTCDLHVRSLANLGQTSAAEAAAAAGVARDALSAERHLLHAIILIDLGDYAEAASAARRAIYLDPSLAVAHLVLGSVLYRLGDFGGAMRACRNSYELAAAWPADEVMPCSGGEPASRVAEAAKAQLSLLTTSLAGVS